MRVRIFGKFIFLLLITCSLNSISLANCDQKSQRKFEQKIHSLTEEYQDEYQEENNALRKKRIEEKYYTNLQEILCLNKVFTFTGRVWNLDFMDDGENYILRIGNGYQDLPYPYFYNYRFSENDNLADKLENISRGDQVQFKFSFINTITPGSDNFNANPYPMRSNPDTGNWVYSLDINLHDITVVN